MRENEELKGFLYKDEKDDFRVVADLIGNIYDRMQDDVSKTIFKERVNYCLTGEANSMHSVVNTTKIGKDFFERLECAFQANYNIYIYGAGRRGTRMVDMFPDYKWTGLIDRNLAGTTYKGINVIGVEEINPNNAFVVISNFSGAKEIRDSLEQCGVELKNTLALADYDDLIANEMYFDLGIVGDKMDGERIFVDAGACDGLNTLSYGKTFFDGGKDFSAVLFEPDYDNAKKCEERLQEYPNVKVYQMGVGAQRSTLTFNSGKQGNSNFGMSGDVTVEITSIDELLQNEKVGFLKMDVEGSEYAAITGASKIIKEQQPIIAVSIYHKFSDIYNLPKLILELNDNYVFYLRHYTLSYGDTVLYAVPKQ